MDWSEFIRHLNDIPFLTFVLLTTIFVFFVIFEVIESVFKITITLINHRAKLRLQQEQHRHEMDLASKLETTLQVLIADRSLGEAVHRQLGVMLGKTDATGVRVVVDPEPPAKKAAKSAEALHGQMPMPRTTPPQQKR